MLSDGQRALLAGDEEGYRTSLRVVSKFIRELAVTGDTNSALEVQGLWYQSLVKQVESEDNYHYAFRWHHDALRAAGRERCDGRPYEEISTNIAFIVPNGVLLGHTQVLLQILRDWRRNRSDINPHVLSLSGFSRELAEQLRLLSIPIAAPKSPTLRPAAAIEWCRDAVKFLKCQVAVWVSVPIWSSYALGSQLASRQVFWSLKFHPIHHGDEVTHVAMTSPGTGPCIINGGSWLRFSPPLTIPFKLRNRLEIFELRKVINEKFIFGSLARTEKFNSRAFAKVAADIVSRCPESIFVYTGHSDSLVVREEFEIRGISSRARFVGWVDTELYAQSIDVFLETFPFGCGVTGAQAINAGTPMISLWRPETLSSYYFASVEEARLAAAHWVIVENETEYRDAAVRIFGEITHHGAFAAAVGVLTDLDASKSDQFLHLLMSDKAS